MIDRRTLLVCATGLASMAILVFAPKQQTALDCIPKDVTVYVDGVALEETPEELALRSDEHHTLFVKGEGYQPEMVVLESEEVDGKHQLKPAEVCVRLRYIGVRRELEVEVEQEPQEAPPAAR